MQKRNVMIFSLLLISILIISGCNTAVGGVRSGSSAKQQPYQVRESDSVLNAGMCPYPTGQAVRVTERAGSCYRIVGCRVKTITNFYGDSVQITKKEKLPTEYIAQIYSESNQLFCQTFTELAEYQVEDRDIATEFRNANPFNTPVPGSGSN